VALGTGQTTGPYTPVAGTPITVSDPSTGVPSNKVQIQNASGFSLSVQVGGLPYSVQPQTATTILTNNEGASITVTPSSTVANQTGTITLVWLLAGQDSPIPDGFMGQSVANQRLVTSGNVAAGANPFLTIPLLSTDTAVVLQLGVGSLAGLNATYSITGGNTAILYASGTVMGSNPYNVKAVGPFAVYGAADSYLTVNIHNIGATQLGYELVALSNGFSQITGTATVSGTVTANVVGGSSTAVGQYTFGGSLRVGNPAVGSGAFVQMLAAPASGYSYRLHSWTIFGLLTTGTGPWISLLDSSVTLATMTSVAEPGFQYLGGMVVTDQVRLYSSSGSYGAGGIVLAYDLIQTPTIT